MGLAQGDKYISSQTGPNGASRSFRYQLFPDRWKGALALLRVTDKHGCANDLIPPDPTNTAFAGIWIAGVDACVAGSVMGWISVKKRLPEPFVKVWVMTDSGKRVTGYVKSNGDWYLLCRKVAAENPEVIRWEDNGV